MKTQDMNPAFKQFGDLLPESGLYPARYVDIFWRANSGRKVTDLEVVFIPRGSDGFPDHHEDAKFWNLYADYIDPWDCDLGNSCAEWMEPDSLNPARVWGQLMLRGFANDAEMIAALEEFAHIEECDWARDMLRAFSRLKEAQYEPA